jgi:charged multivesicular body protein 2A
MFAVFDAERIREQKHALDRSARQLERERASLERDEKKLVNDIKIAAKKNQMVSLH